MFQTDEREKCRIARDVLGDLPDWFGIPEALEAYIGDVARLPTYTVMTEKKHPAAFVSLRATSSHAFEVYVMGVKRAFHRRRLGTALMESAKAYAIQKGAAFLTVKTLSPSRENEAYLGARRFYEACGFLPLEEFPTLWGENNPCLLMILPLFPTPGIRTGQR